MVSTVYKEAAFSFTSTTSDDLLKEIQRVDLKKATQELRNHFPRLIVDFLKKNLIAVILKVLFLMIWKRQW